MIKFVTSAAVFLCLAGPAFAAPSPAPHAMSGHMSGAMMHAHMTKSDSMHGHMKGNASKGGSMQGHMKGTMAHASPSAK